MNDTIHDVEVLLGEVSMSTLVVMVILSITLTWAFITKIWPTIKSIGTALLKRRDERNKQQRDIHTLNEWKQGTETVLKEIQQNQETVAKSLESILQGQDLLMDAQKATFEVLTQMLSCMSSEKDPDECVQEAMGTISKFLIHEHGRVQ